MKSSQTPPLQKTPPGVPDTFSLDSMPSVSGLGAIWHILPPAWGRMLQQALQTPNSPLAFCLTQLQLVLAPAAWLFGLSEPKNRA